MGPSQRSADDGKMPMTGQQSGEIGLYREKDFLKQSQLTNRTL
jgi:hypothetical protein